MAARARPSRALEPVTRTVGRLTSADRDSVTAVDPTVLRCPSSRSRMIKDLRCSIAQVSFCVTSIEPCKHIPLPGADVQHQAILCRVKERRSAVVS